ncbi:MAG: OsmC family protein [Deltaproteobacteria bacterium]|nr:OsmC family protein [Deltaproteobacteria bacterium]
MMGTLAGFLARKDINAVGDTYRADVEGDIENVEGVLKITQIRVNYHIKVPKGKTNDAKDALSTYLKACPSAQSVIGCIRIHDDAVIEEIE